MSLLLDTQVLLWCLADPDRLSRKARRRIESASEVVYVSVVSAWEIEIKRALGKLRAPDDLSAQMTQKRFTELALRMPHVSQLGSLPPLHRDPFDRMLVAQAQEENLTIVTADALVRSYPVKTLAAQ
jgi:PIN domain nuclease of toxin-antitoxin system